MNMLLLVNSDPGSNGVGELFLRDAIASLSGQEIIRFSTVQRAALPDAGIWAGGRGIERHLPMSSVPVLSSSIHAYSNRILAKKLCSDAMAQLQDSGIATVWAVLNNPTIIRVTRLLLEASSDIKVLSMVWDDPNYFVRNQRLDSRSKRAVLDDFSFVLRRSSKISVISQEMGSLYARKYGVSSTVVRHGIDETLALPWNSSGSEDSVRIGFSGSLYAKEEWNILVDALPLVEKMIARPVYLEYIGTFPRFGARRPARFRDHGRQSLAQTLKLLNGMSIAYLPYWLGERHREVATTSFPGKLSAYCAAGVPVFFHGPTGSAAGQFLKDYPFGRVFNGTQPAALALAIRDFLADPLFHSVAQSARARAMECELGRQAMARNVMEFIS